MIGASSSDSMPTSTDIYLALVGATLAAMLVFVAGRVGLALSLAIAIFAVGFALATLGFLRVPHVMVAALFPVFAALPTIGRLFYPGIGPLKDVMLLALLTAVTIHLASSPRGSRWAGDSVIAWSIGVLFALYIVNAAGGHGVAWFHGVRLMFEPMIALVGGLTLPRPQKTLRWAGVSVLSSAALVAGYGVVQQLIGPARLVELGYLYNADVRFLGTQLRSFGTLADPFSYAAFIMLAIAVLIFSQKRAGALFLLGPLLVLGAAVSLVRSALMIAVVLTAFLLLRNRRVAGAVALLAAAVVLGATAVVGSAGSDPQHRVSDDASSAALLNGRTRSWGQAIGSPTNTLFGRGVGTVGTAAERAASGLERTVTDTPDQAASIDSGYVATIVDVGLAGIVLLMVLFGRLAHRARVEIQRGFEEGWLVAGILAVTLIDALTRASFSGFPNADFAMLLMGLALASAAERPGS